MPWQKSEGPGKFDPARAKTRIERYCTYQERCHQEVRRKLLDMGIYGATLEALLADLIEAGFLNEERFARSYARGKFNMKGWGRNRISRELKMRNISPFCIKAGLSEIDETRYIEQLQSLLQKRKDKADPSVHPAQQRQQLIEYATRKGYEWDIIESVLKKMTDSGI